MATYDSTLAASLQQLATRAITPISAIEVLPTPWSLVNLITGTTAQGFTAIGQSGATTQLVLALGAQWGQWVTSQGFLTPVTLSALPTYFYAGGGTASGASFDLATLTLYGQMRTTMLSQLQAAMNLIPIVSQAQLLICGQGIGAALAQLAAFDLRAQNQGSAFPFASVRVYTFSAPSLANAALQTQFSAQLDDAWAVTAGVNTTVDFFPSAPTAASGFAALGAAQTVSASVPSVESPWWERSGALYTQSFSASGAQVARASASPLAARRSPTRRRSARATAAGSTASPAGYSADTAYTLGLLVAAVNQMNEHPTLPLNIPQPWTLVATTSASAPWGAVFRSTFPAAVAVVFRTESSFAESASSLCLPGPSNPTWLPSGAAMHLGAVTLYASLRDALRAQLGDMDLSTSTLYVAGHSLGALLAQVAAADLVSSPLAGSPVPYTYSLGAPAGVGYSFGSAVCSGGSCAYLSQTYLISRDSDVVAPVNWLGMLTTFGQSVSLTGTTSTDDEARHSLSSYVSLLNPSA